MSLVAEYPNEPVSFVKSGDPLPLILPYEIEYCTAEVVELVASL